MSKNNYISLEEFRKLGYLQELNRRFLHPLGLSMEVKVNISKHYLLNAFKSIYESYINAFNLKSLLQQR